MKSKWLFEIGDSVKDEGNWEDGKLEDCIPGLTGVLKKDA
jgi:hypothetical protein